LVIACLLLATHAFADDDHAIPSVTHRPWSASTSYGVGAVRARSDEANVLAAATFELGIRRRLLPNLEVSLALSGLFARGYGIGGLYADVRYRLLAERPWDPFVFGGVGFGSHVPVLHAGIGVERRFVSWGFACDVQIAHGTGDDTVTVRGKGSELEHFGALGAGLSISATYYWGRPKKRRFVP
jgi:hypothetical protein